MDREKVLETISKLMKLSLGTDQEGEKKLAEEKVASLIADYNIEQRELRESGNANITEISITIGKFGCNMVMWKMRLYNYIASQNGVYLTYIHNIIYLVGNKEDIDNVIYYYNFINVQVAKMANEWYKEKKKFLRYFGKKANPRMKNDYREGLTIGVGKIFMKMKEDAHKYQEQKEGIIVVDEMDIKRQMAEDDYKKDGTKVRNKTSNCRQSTSFSEGYADSENISLNKGLDKSGNPILQLGV